jgi:aspartate dehydrogenase
MRIGLIGGGNIGKFLLESININGLLPNSKIVGLYTRNEKSAKQLAEQFSTDHYTTIQSLIYSDVDLIIEAATIQVAKDVAAPVLESGKDLVLSSVGALADLELYQHLENICHDKGSKVYLPSGAIGGLDILKAAKSIGELETVSIITKKPPRALPGAPTDCEHVMFEGDASEAIELFPKNINVSIILSLAGLGPEHTRVKIISDPKAEKNNHIIEATGSFGKLTLKVENNPMPNNPKTSYLAALSVLSALKNKDASILVG